MKKTTIIIVMAMLCLNFEANAQLFKGRVVDSKDQSPLPGATIKVQNQQQTTLSNDDGYFELNLPNGRHVLHVQYLSYLAKDVVITLPLKSPLLIELTASENALKEVEINAGYYTVKERERTGSISSVSAEMINKQAINNPLQALQGRVPGLEITQLTGVPGGGFEVHIRGRNSIQSGNEILYIIDGVTYPSTDLTISGSIIQGRANPLSMINPGDIESIEVLKDADATAIYGSRGANGVILINTKKAIPGELRVNVNINQGLGEIASRLKLMNTTQYLSMRMEALKNTGLAPTATDLDINGAWNKEKYTDWQEVMIGGKANISNTSLNISGGTAYSNYMLSGNYYNEGTVFPGSFGFKRGGLHTSLSFGSVKSRFQANFNGSYSRSVTLLPSSEPTSQILRSPNVPDPFDEYGQLQWYDNDVPIGSNPMAELLNTINGIADNLIGNTTLSYKILNQLVFKTSFGYNTLRKEELRKSVNAARNPASNPISTQRKSDFGNIANNSWTLEPNLNYESKFGPGKITSLIGMSFQQNISEQRNIVASNFSSDAVMENIASATTFNVSSVSYAKYKYAALFARLNYSLLSRYYLNLTARRDGSSRFGPGKQFANFGAVGVAWLFSEEPLIKDKLSFLSFGKLRASYGLTGNDQIGNYLYLDLYTGSSSYQGMPSISSSGIRNPDFAWETNKKAEVAIQLGFLDDRINFQVAYFRNRSSSQLLRQVLPPSVGSSSVTANLPAVVQNTGWEIESTFHWIKQKNWFWQTDFNISFPKNKLLAYPDIENSPDRINFIVGEPLSIDRYYNITVDRQSGLYASEDFNQNGQRDDGDKYLNKFLGQIFYGGFQNSIRYKQFNLDFLVSFNKQTGYSSLYGSLVPGIFANSLPLFNQQTFVLRRWQKPGDVSAIPKFSNSTTGNSNYGLLRDGAQGFEDVSFARLKTLSLSYSFPKPWLSKLKVKDLQFSVQGQNLFTWSNYEALDPEIPSSTALKLPPLRVLMLGLKVTL